MMMKKMEEPDIATMSDKIIHITSKKEHDELLAANKDQYWILDFHASWCGPCHMIAPVFEQSANNYPSIKFAKIDVDAVPDLAQHYRIRAMPTFKVVRYAGGENENAEDPKEQVDTLQGASKERLVALVEKIDGLA
ncbi:thioredoxin family protein, partial [Paucibacter sp. DJ4R-1]|nr:thioredoxin family protein [Paucibacter sp. DJ4R-1]